MILGPACGDDNTYVEHQGKLDERPLAACYLVRGARVWIQKRYLRDSNDKFLVLPTWMAKSKGLSGRY